MKVQYTGTVLNVADYMLQDGFKLAPNPAQDSFQILFESNPAALSSLKITDLNGRIVKEIPNPEFNQEVSVESLASGVYIVKIIDGTGRSQSEKLIIH